MKSYLDINLIFSLINFEIAGHFCPGIMGKIAAEEIYRRMSAINRAYTLAGERLYYQKVVGDKEKMQRIDKKNKIKEEYGELLQLFPNN